jgi:hypothetical protein
MSYQVLLIVAVEKDIIEANTNGRFEIFTAVNMKITSFWDTTLRTLIHRYQSFEATCRLHMHEGSRFFENVDASATK